MKLTVSMSSPCHEDRSKFTPTTKGGFCDSCKKEVIDFTRWTDREVMAYLGKGLKGCGRFREDQLRVYEGRAEKKKRAWWVAAATIVLMVTLNKPAAAQSKQVAKTEQISSPSAMDRLREWSERRSDTSVALPTKVAFEPELFLTGTVGGFIAVETRVTWATRVVTSVIDLLY